MMMNPGSLRGFFCFNFCCISIFGLLYLRSTYQVYCMNRNTEVLSSKNEKSNHSYIKVSKGLILSRHEHWTLEQKLSFSTIQCQLIRIDCKTIHEKLIWMWCFVQTLSMRTTFDLTEWFNQLSLPPIHILRLITSTTFDFQVYHHIVWMANKFNKWSTKFTETSSEKKKKFN